jgi:hypothetical protein
MTKPNIPVVGYGLLASVASQKLLFISYGHVYDILSERFYWRERWNGHNWCDPVKGVCCDVARINRENNEPLLSCLVRRKDGTVGMGYMTAAEIRYGQTLGGRDEIQVHADREREKCWSYFGVY